MNNKTMKTENICSELKKRIARQGKSWLEIETLSGICHLKPKLNL